MTNLYFIDSRNVIAKGGSDTVSRHNMYATEFKSLPGQATSEVTVCSPSCGNMTGSNFSTLGKNSNSYLQYLTLTLKKIYSDSPECVMLIAGDPWLSGFSAILIKRLLRRKKMCIKIQMQLHADISDRKWVKFAWKNRVKRVIGLAILQFADSIRFVSHNQMKLMVDKLNFSTKNIFVAPVYMNLASVGTYYLSDRPRVLGFVGRMEKERGTEELIRLVEKLSKTTSKKFSVRLIGGGSQANLVSESLSQILGDDFVDAIGQVNQTELMAEWGKIGTLVNLAPVESYGRTIREAAAFGIPVWSLPSSGFNQLKKDFPMSWIREINLADPESDLMAELDILFELHTSPMIHEHLISEQQLGLDMLGNSWVCNHAK